MKTFIVDKMKSIVLISFLFVCVQCKLAKESSELNYMIAKPETNILSPVLSGHAPVNLVKYGPLAGHPIQALPYGQNLAYAKPYLKTALNYGHDRHYQAAPVDLHPFEFGYAAKKYPHLHPSELMLSPTKLHNPYLINANHHLKANHPLYHNAIGHPTGSSFHFITDHQQRDFLGPLNSIEHINEPRHQINPHYLNQAYSPLANSFVSAPINSYHHPTSIIKYSSPISTSYFMKINHIVPDNKYHHALTAKTEIPFFEQKFEHKLPGPFATSHYNYAPNFINHHHSSIKK